MSGAAAATKAGGPATLSSLASDTAPLLVGARADDNFGLMGGGSRRAYNVVGLDHNGAFPGGGEGRWRCRPHGQWFWWRQRQNGLRRPRPRAPRRLSRRWQVLTEKLASQAAETMEGRPAIVSAASSATLLPERVRAAGNIGFTGGGNDEDRRACNAVHHERCGTSPGGGEGRQQPRPHGWRQ